MGVGAAIIGAGAAFCSCVGGCLAAGAAAVTSFATAAASVLGSVATTVGGIATTLGGMLDAACIKILGKVAGPIVSKLIKETAKKIATDLAKKVLGVNDSPEEVGYRLKEASDPKNKDKNWKTLDDFDGNFDEFYEYLKTVIPDENIDRTRLAENMTEYSLIGSAAIVAEMARKKGVELADDFLENAGRANMTAAETEAVMDVFRDFNNNKVMFSDFLSGVLPIDKSLDINNALAQKLMEVNGCTENEAYARIEEMRRAVTDLQYVRNHVYREKVDDLEERRDRSPYLKEINVSELEKNAHRDEIEKMRAKYFPGEKFNDFKDGKK